MAITAGETITHTDLNTEAGQQRAGLTTQAAGRAKDLQVDVAVEGLVTGTALPVRSILFTPQDDMELRAIRLYVRTTTASIAVSATLTCPAGTEYLLNETVSTSMTTTSTADEFAGTSYTAATGDKIFLLKGVQYQLAIASDSASAVDVAQGTVYMRARARGRSGRALPPVIFRNGDTLSPDDINLLQEGMKRDLDRSIANRFVTSIFILPFGAINFSSDGSEEKKFYIKSPLAYEIVAVELYVAGAAASYTLSSSATGWTDVSATTTGATAYASATDSFVASVAANTEISFTLSSGSTLALTACHAVIHIRHDRHAGAPPSWTPLDVKSASNINDAVTASALATSFDDYATAYATDASSGSLLRIWVDSRRNTAGSSAVSVRRLPASTRQLSRADTILVRDSAGDTLFQVSGPTAGTVLSQTETSLEDVGSVAKTQTISATYTQAGDGPTDSSLDWTSSISVSSGSGPIERATLVLYWI